MGVFGAIPETVSDAIAAGQSGAVTVEVAGTLMSFVPDATKDDPQTWWTRLGVFIETEGLVTSRHSVTRTRDAAGWRLNRLRFRDYLPGAKVLVWSTAHTVFIYIRQGQPKREAAAAVRLALAAAGRRPLGAVHASIIGVGVAGGIQVPGWLGHASLPRGAVHVACGAVSLTVVATASSLFLQWPVHPDQAPVGGASLPPTSATAAQPAAVTPVFPRRSVNARPKPSTFVQAAPRLSPVPLPTTTAPKPAPSPPPAPSAVPDPVPSSLPLPSRTPYPLPSGADTSPPPVFWWLPSSLPFPISGT